MNRDTDYTFSNLLNERRDEIEAEYVYDLKMAALCFPLAVIVSWIIIAVL